MRDNYLGLGINWLALVVVMTFALSAESTAAVPQLINYQGRLTNSIGAPLDTTVTLIFTVYADSLAVTNLWSETHPGVVMKDGLFQVLLGSVTPLSASVFDGSKRWLGVQLQGGPASAALIPMVSAAYAYHALKADTADIAKGTSSPIWEHHGNYVYLVPDGDSIGIGTHTPGATLDVIGDIRSNHHLLSKYFNLGVAKSVGGIFNLYGAYSSQPILYATEEPFIGGIYMLYYDFQNNPTHAFYTLTSGQGVMTVYRDTAYTEGVSLIGRVNGALVKVEGPSRSIILDTRVSGDSSVMLPYSAINATEILNEAGLSNSRRTSGSISLDNTIKTILTRHSYYPTSGWVLALATVSLSLTHIGGTNDVFDFAISGTPGVIPTDQNFTMSLSANLPSGTFTFPVTIHSYLSVSAGEDSLFLLVRQSAGTSSAVGDASLTAVFFPTNYLMLKSPAGVAGDPEQASRDAVDDAKMQTQIEMLRQEFDAKLKAMEEEMKKQHDGGGK